MTTVTSVCIVIPVYNHGEEACATVERIRSLPGSTTVVLVNDGSSETCSTQLRALDVADKDVILVELPSNRGKGAAVKAGLRRALAEGFSHAIQLDADGQHDALDIEKFIQVADAHPNAIVAGVPEFDENVSKGRYYARYLTHVWVWINSLSLRIKDSMCGFRVYPLEETNRLIANCSIGDRMDFDPELLVRWVWQGGEIINVRTKVLYPAGGLSNFRMWADNVLISRMHAKLFFLMLVRLPAILWRRLVRRQKH